mmetsp:Transcript_48744/g.95595  ORF Transcript_48744/g.95595 Transcript_48744/m.95595 type:complete len:297 (+) Transcript_48744:32-922(+)
MSKKKTESKVAWKNVLAGGIAGATEATIMFPTEFVKTQLQLQARAQGKQQYKGVLDCATQIVKQKGFFGLYSGCTTLIVGSIPKAAVRFGAFSQIKAKLAGPDGKLSQLNTVAAGMSAGLCEAVLAVTPMETVKTKLIHDANSANPRYRGLFHGVRTMVAEDGIGSIYKGLGPTMARQGFNQAIRFTIFDNLNRMYTSTGREKTATSSFVCGMGAGFISVYLTMPIDVVKTQMQGLEASQYKSSFDCISSIVKNKGVLALWKGTTPRLGRVTFSGGIIFSSYEQIMKMILKASPDQ